MMQDELVRKRNYEVTTPTPQLTPTPTRQPVVNSRLRLSGFEKTLMVTGVVLIVALMVSIVNTKFEIGRSQRKLQDTTSQTTELKTHNQNLKQELDSNENDAIAKMVKQDQLSINNGQVRDVTR
ncbi:hypothetical protein B808_1072 [Fructilactobacillus florum 8D]|uniref:Cell division protein FtsL n=1 Tax=Fructilactobacillus florum 8D TaxID=1221538 RepID=W9EJV7_9LACO|nr:hypothetical protein [Fructilactobacillus florum]EKK20323.1 hypothetical protein B807_962 [Fructilactobacillus florum 2F]ETO39964.1 hypothetical protein B808_1072 [Fructilactobacillus florum 8D]